MLNEERVKHMVKLAFYETKGGSEEIEISCRRKKEYIATNTFWSFFWMTIAYVVLIFFLKTAFFEEYLQIMNRQQKLLVLMSVIGLYIVLLISYIVKARKAYQMKHARAHHHVKKFKEGLAELEELYEKEDVNE